MNSQSAGYTRESANEAPTSHKWIKLIVAVWAVRMGMVGVGMMIPMLVGLIASVPRSNPLFVPDTIIEIRTWEYPSRDNVRVLLKGNVPVVLKGATLPQPHSYELLLQAWLPESLDLVKESNIPNFTYFDASSPWGTSFAKGSAATHNRSLSYTHTQMNAVSFLEAIRAEGKDGQEESTATPASPRYLYSTVALGDDRPTQSPLLQSVAPFMALYDEHHANEHKKASRAFLWMASRDVYVTPHYDVDHNFLLQLAGTKRIVLTTPAGYDLFRPGSSLSPFWRQSLGAVATPAAPDDEAEVGPGRGMFSLQRIKDAVSQCYAQPLDPMGMDTGGVADALCFTGYNHSSALFHPTSVVSWEVLLAPGDVLYIPPGYFHSVLYTSPRSHSVNMFVNSLVQDVQTKLRNVASLPYTRLNEGEFDLDKLKPHMVLQMEVLQLAAVGSLCRNVFRNLYEHHDIELLRLKRRYHTRYHLDELVHRLADADTDTDADTVPVAPPAPRSPSDSCSAEIEVGIEGESPNDFCRDRTPEVLAPTPTAAPAPNASAYRCTKELRLRAGKNSQMPHCCCCNVSSLTMY